MDKKLARLLSYGMGPALLVMLLFAAVTAKFDYYLAAAEVLVIGLVWLMYRRRANRKKKELREYVEGLAFQMEGVSKNALVNFPLPMIILQMDSGEIIWSNERFSEVYLTHDRFRNPHITEVASNLDIRWLTDGKEVCPYDIQVDGRKYRLYGSMTSTGGVRLAMLFWVDTTELNQMRTLYDQTRPVVALVTIDSYDELFKDKTETEKSSMTAAVDRALSDWASPASAIIRKLERDKYLLVFDNQALVNFTADKFSLLEKVHEIKNPEGIAVTLSMGIGKGGETYRELIQFANLALDMALSRGGDQVVIKSKAKNPFEFYGGRTKELEKRTKVKSRVTANALKQLMQESSAVFVTGHKISDLDSVGATLGICCAVRAAGKPCYAVVDIQRSAAKELAQRARILPEYAGVFISEQEALEICDAQSLLVVVDTSNPAIVDAPALLETIPRVAVIDHHRRASGYIENPIISMTESYASSASELVTELLQYIIKPSEMLKTEAEGLLSGIVLDTKSFTVKAGVRTFEAAAWLKQCGADTVEARRMYSGDLQGYLKKFQLMAAAHPVAEGMSVAVSDQWVDRAVAAQAADELINLSGIDAAFTVAREGEGSFVSARSYGAVNVQMVMEKIGGGGSLNQAGAQFADKTPDEVETLLEQAIFAYVEDMKKAAEPETAPANANK